MELKFWRNKAGQEIDFVLLNNRLPLLIEIKTTINKPEVPQAMKIFIKFESLLGIKWLKEPLNGIYCLQIIHNDGTLLT